MRSMRLVAVVLGFGLANLALLFGERNLSREKRAIDVRLSRLSEEVERARRASDRRRGLEELVSLAATRVNAGQLGIAPIRERLLAAERGIDVERLSLEFRPASGLGEGVEGSQIHSSLRGTLLGVHAYLDRIEALHLPLVTDAVTWRSDSGRLTVTIRGSVRFNASTEPPAPPEFSPAEVEALEAWLDRGRAPRLGRDLFSFRMASSVPVPERGSEKRPEILEDAPEAPIAATGVEPPASVPAVPVLAGFVLARPELEPDVARRVLAVLRFEDQPHLVKLGDRVGGYVVEDIVARESVTLANAETGERIVLRLP